MNESTSKEINRLISISLKSEILSVLFSDKYANVSITQIIQELDGDGNIPCHVKELKLLSVNNILEYYKNRVIKNYILLVWDRNEENPELYLIPRDEIDVADYFLLIEANGKYISVKDQDDYLWKLKKLLDDEWDKYLVTYEMLTLAEDQHINKVITSGFVIDQKASYGNHFF